MPVTRSLVSAAPLASISISRVTQHAKIEAKLDLSSSLRRSTGADPLGTLHSHSSLKPCLVAVVADEGAAVALLDARILKYLPYPSDRLLGGLGSLEGGRILLEGCDEAAHLLHLLLGHWKDQCIISMTL